MQYIKKAIVFTFHKMIKHVDLITCPTDNVPAVIHPTLVSPAVCAAVKDGAKQTGGLA